MPEFPVSFRFPNQIPNLKESTSPALGDVEVNEAGRSWSANTHNINMQFTEAVTISATGWSMTVNSVAKTLTYVSGTGTSSVVFQVNTVIHDNDDIRISYDPAVGNTVSVTGSLAIKKLVGVEVTENLSRRIRFTLCDKNDANVANETVKASVLEYHNATVADDISYGPRAGIIGLSGLPDVLGGANPQFMQRANVATVTTTAAALVDMEYTGAKRAGAFVYVAILRTNGENLIVRDTVQ